MKKNLVLIVAEQKGFLPCKICSFFLKNTNPNFETFWFLVRVLVAPAEPRLGLFCLSSKEKRFLQPGNWSWISEGPFQAKPFHDSVGFLDLLQAEGAELWKPEGFAPASGKSRNILELFLPWLQRRSFAELLYWLSDSWETPSSRGYSLWSPFCWLCCCLFTWLWQRWDWRTGNSTISMALFCKAGTQE